MWHWWFLLFIPVFWWLQLITHELSHVIAGRIFEGRRLKGFYPYPHKFKDELFFARYNLGEPTKVGREKYRHLAPVFSSYTIMGLCLLGLGLSGSSIFIIPAGIAMGDYLFFMWGLIWGSPNHDAQRFLKAIRK
jgi:hypothetical protein